MRIIKKIALTIWFLSCTIGLIIFGSVPDNYNYSGIIGHLLFIPTAITAFTILGMILCLIIIVLHHIWTWKW